jgi:DNA-binding NtrC family response regulator
MQSGHSERKRVLLLVDDEPEVLSHLHHTLKNTDIRLLASTDPYGGFELLAKNAVGVVICGQRMPGLIGTEFLSRVKELYPTTVRIVLSSHTDLKTVIDAVNHCAIYKFLTKPFEEKILLKSLEDAFHLHEVEEENFLLSRKIQDMIAAAASEKSTFAMSQPPFNHRPSA